jgi:copper homeostasis protein
MNSTARILVEVCIGSVADLELAVAAGADRVELCGALELGGLTPSIGLSEAVLVASPLPVVVMLRPRAGGFHYDGHEFAAMQRDAERFLDLGASGLVFGILDQHGRVDSPRCRKLVQSAGTAQTIFHRAFDFVRDQRAALDALIDIGMTRVLTSGGKSTAVEGVAAIRQLNSLADARIQILPGGGINAGNVVETVRATDCNQVHIGAAIRRNDASMPGDAGIELVDQRFTQGPAHRGVSGEAVAQTIAALQTAKLH